MVRCKFSCHTKEVYPDGAGSVKMYPVYSGSEENKKFFAATPGGVIDLQVLNPEALKQLEEGKEYYIDITLAE